MKAIMRILLTFLLLTSFASANELNFEFNKETRESLSLKLVETLLKNAESIQLKNGETIDLVNFKDSNVLNFALPMNGRETKKPIIDTTIKDIKDLIRASGGDSGTGGSN